MTVLQLTNDSLNNNIFIHTLDDKFHIYKVDEIFDYDKLIYNKLSSEEKTAFDNIGLKTGYYRVVNTYKNLDEGEVIVIELKYIN